MTYEISIHWRNGDCRERYAVHAEADPEEELRGAADACGPGETAILYWDGVEVYLIYQHDTRSRPMTLTTGKGA